MYMEKYWEIEILWNNTWDPFLSFIVGTHWDERAPIKALDILKQDLKWQDLKKNIKIIYANTEAIKENKRFIEKDLNRSFGGWGNWSYEERLANILKEELKKTLYNFDFHTTNFEIIAPYWVVSTYSATIKEILSCLWIVNNIFTDSECLIKDAPNGIWFEIWYDKNPRSVTNTLIIMKNILEYFWIIEKKRKDIHSEINIFLIYKLIDKLNFLAIDNNLSDFKQVYIWDNLWISVDWKQILAEEKFFPIWVQDPRWIRMAKKIHIEE